MLLARSLCPLAILAVVLLPAVAEGRRSPLRAPGTDVNKRLRLAQGDRARLTRRSIPRSRSAQMPAPRSVASPVSRASRMYRSVGNLSTTSMLLGSASKVARLGRMVGPLGGSLTGIGSVGLGVVSIRDLVHARHNEKRLDAAHGIAWSLQGMTGFGYALQSRAGWVAPVTRWTGVAGGALQVGVGAYRLVTGIRTKSRERIVLGSVDVGAGLCWAASSCALATPWTMAGFIGLTAARMAYSQRDQLKSAARSLGRSTRSACATAAGAARGRVSRARQGLRRSRAGANAPRPRSPKLRGSLSRLWRGGARAH